MVSIGLTVILTLGVLHNSITANTDDCMRDDYLPWNCEIVADVVVIRCHTDSLTSNFLPTTTNNKSKQCVATATSLQIVCTNNAASSFKSNHSLEAFRDLQEIVFLNCCVDRLRMVDLERFQLNQIDIQGTKMCQHGPGLIVEESPTSRFDDMLKLKMEFQNLRNIPHKVLCNLREIWLDGNALTDLSEFQFSSSMNCWKNMTQLSLSNNKFHSLVDQSVSHLDSLISLDLSHNALSTIQDEALAGLNSLIYLNLDSNLIQNISVSMLAHTPTLLILRLQNNKISKLVNNSFDGLYNLKQLHLGYNAITSIEPASFDNLIGVNNLSICHNRLQRVDNMMWRHFTDLHALDLSFNVLGGSIEHEIFEGLNSLFYLDLSENKFEIINSFAGLNHLRELKLGSNRLNHIQDDAFQNLKALSTLVLSHNKLTIITGRTFSGLHNLENLELQNNRLKQISNSSFKHCISLKSLILRYNLLVTLPDISMLHNILTLDISHNLVSSLTKDCFWNLTKLVHLYVSYNSIREVASSQFRKNLKLYRLDLNNNKLKETSWTISDYASLTILNLQFNQLETLDKTVVSANVKHLNMSHNRISQFPHRVAPIKSHQLTHLDLSYNELNTAYVMYPSLVEYNLRSNNLTFLLYSPGPRTALEKFDLRDNKFLIVRSSIFDMMSRDKYSEIQLEGIMFKCDCTMPWLLDRNLVLNRAKIVDLDRLVCEVPVLGKQKGREASLLRVSMENFLCDFRRDKLPRFEWQEPPTCPLRCTCYTNSNWGLVIAYCSNQNLTYVPPDLPFNSVRIYLDGNNLTQIQRSPFSLYNLTKIIYLNSSRIKKLEDGLFQNMFILKELHLEYNELTVINRNIFGHLPRLEKLYLHHNRLYWLETASFSLLTSLKTLRLDFNALTTFPPFDIQVASALESLTLRGNPWHCDCSGTPKQYVTLLDGLSEKLVDRNQTVCSTVPNGGHDNITLFQFYSGLCDAIFPIVAISAPVGVVAVMTVAAILVFVYRFELQVIIYHRYALRIVDHESVDDADKQFDAFVAYHSLDEPFVAEELVPRLEGGDRPFRLCLHQRNFLGGGFIVNSILDAIECSRRTIVIMSEHFNKSNWCRLEFKSAHTKMLEDRCRRLILIVLGEVPEDLDPEVKLYIKTNTYLTVNDRLFWEKLNYAMPKPVPLCNSQIQQPT